MRAEDGIEPAVKHPTGCCLTTQVLKDKLPDLKALGLDSGQMRKPSRSMSAQPRLGMLAGAAIGLLVFAIPGLWWWPLAIVVPAIIAIFLVYDWRRCRRIAAVRQGETICSFARSFDRRGLDTWIIRAVYEELADRFPVRAEDNLVRDLRIYGEELDIVGARIASRVGRDLDGATGNPLFGKVQTVRDLVAFLHNQPRLSHAQTG